MSDSSKPTNIVVLVTALGKPVFQFFTDRDEFPATATYWRDRVFVLGYQGDIAGHPTAAGLLPTGTLGAIYVEAEPWRLALGNLDKPRPRRRARKTAKILRFPMREAGNG